ncbi:MAG: PIN domain-containing protein [Chloroflexi bacterium]|nr:PIN domain-containing protein [Chloroflexota bacterium]
MPSRFLDTNILLRYFTRDDEEKARNALALFVRVEQGEERVETSTLVIFETVFTLLRFYRVERPRIRELIATLLRLRGLHLPGKHLCLDALDLYVQRNISFADAYNAVYMKSRGLSEIYTWDTDFDKIEGITRVEPTADREGQEREQRSTPHCRSLRYKSSADSLVASLNKRVLHPRLFLTILPHRSVADMIAFQSTRRSCLEFPSPTAIAPGHHAAPMFFALRRTTRRTRAAQKRRRNRSHRPAS